MGEELLVKENIEAGARFLREFNDYRPVSVACWFVPAESENLYLYIASDQIDDTNFDVACGEVVRLLQGKNSQWLNMFQVKVANSNDRFAREAIAIRDRYSNPQATRYRGTSLGGVGIEGAYIYPPIFAMNAAS